MNTTPPPLPTHNPPPLPQPVRREPVHLQWLGLGLAMVAVLVVLGLLGPTVAPGLAHKAHMAANRDRAEMVNRMQSLEFPRDSALFQSLSTAKGCKLWTDTQGFFPGARTGFDIVGFQNSGDLCDVRMTRTTVDGAVLLHVRLVRAGQQWQFDDFFLSKVDGREVNLWGSFIQEHPILASAKVFKPELQAAYGEAKAAFKGAADTVHDVATIVTVLKGL